MDVFKTLLNKTRNDRLKLEIQNIQCYPSEEVKQKWDKLQEIEKTSGQVFEDEELQENGAYEYYDETELNGTIFYFDMRHLLNCSGEEKPAPVEIVSTTPISNSPGHMQSGDRPTKASSSPVINIVPTTPETTREKSTKISNKGTLDLTTAESTTSKAPVITEKKVGQSSRHNEISQEVPTYGTDEKRKEKKDNIYTTSRLATVSAKPIDQKGFDDREMASDEAKPDRIKAHRSIQEEIKETPNHKVNNAHRNLICLPTLILMILCYRVFL